MSVSGHQPTSVSLQPADFEADVELVARAQRDSLAFGELYDRYVDSIFKYCYRRLGGRQVAEDATSQVFMRALASLPRFQTGRGSFRSWLFTIAHNVVVDVYRSDHPTMWDDAAFELADTGPTPEELAIVADSGDRLRQAVAQLPTRQRQVVELRLAGLTGPEIAQVLGCKTRTVDVAQFRAIGSLRALMIGNKDEKRDDNVQAL